MGSSEQWWVKAQVGRIRPTTQPSLWDLPPLRNKYTTNPVMTCVLAGLYNPSAYVNYCMSLFNRGEYLRGTNVRSTHDITGHVISSFLKDTAVL